MNGDFHREEQKEAVVISGLFTTIDSALVQKIRFDAISNNIANVNTNGFKKDVISFEHSPFAYALAQTSSTDFSGGNIIQTGNPLDVALDASAFFKIETGQGERYTQNGAFTLDAQGYLVTGKGERVMGENGPVEIGDGVVSISENGEVFVDGQTVDRLAVVGFNRPEDLKKEGNSTYSNTGGDNNVIQPQGIRVKQGFLEKSNVDPTQEMVKMIEMFRCYESSQQVIQTMGEMTDKMITGFGLE